jgi:hypothetical protein
MTAWWALCILGKATRGIIFSGPHLYESAAWGRFVPTVDMLTGHSALQIHWCD